MRSTRGKTRAYRAERKQTFTTAARVTAPLHSNTPPASRKAGTPANLMSSRSRGWHVDSMYYRTREGLGQ